MKNFIYLLLSIGLSLGATWLISPYDKNVVMDDLNGLQNPNQLLRAK